MERNTESRSQIWRIKTIAVGAAAGIIAALAALAAFAAWVCAAGSFSVVARFAPWGVWGACGFFAGSAAALVGRRNPLPHGLISAGVSAVLISLFALCLPQAEGSLLCFLPCLVAGVLGSIVGMGLREKFVRKS